MANRDAAGQAERIAAHKARRAAGWLTIEAPHALAEALDGGPADAAVLVDCLTLWLSNLLEGSFDIDAQTARLLEALARRAGPTVLVSNEVGLGIVPDKLAALGFRVSHTSDRAVELAVSEVAREVFG